MIEYDIYQPAKHLEQVVELEKILWTGKTSDEIRNIFKWKYPDNVNLVNGFVALDGERVVGFRGFFIQDYVKEGRVFPVAVLGDAVVHHEYQRRGIFGNLTKKALDYYSSTQLNSILALSSNTKSSLGNIKLGWTPFLRKEYRISLSFSNFLFGKLRKRTSLKCNGYTVEIINLEGIKTLAVDLDKLCQLVDGKGGISLRRNAHYWTWRFANPNWNAQFVILKSRDGIKGIVAFQKEKRKGIPIIRILDIVVTDFSLFTPLIHALKAMTDVWCYLILSSCNVPVRELNGNFPLKRQSKLNNPSDYFLIKSLQKEHFLTGDEKMIINYSNID